MAHEVRFQVGILPDVEWQRFLDRFRHVEALGFDMAGTGDQFVDSMDNSSDSTGVHARLQQSTASGSQLGSQATRLSRSRRGEAGIRGGPHTARHVWLGGYRLPDTGWVRHSLSAQRSVAICADRGAMSLLGPEKPKAVAVGPAS